jgi:hypothetical protein
MWLRAGLNNPIETPRRVWSKRRFEREHSKVWNPADINNLNFGVVVRVAIAWSGGGSSSATAYVDYVSVTVYYDPPPTGPVGGFMEPVNKVAIIAPYVALLGLVSTVAVVVAKPWKKPEN